MSGQVVCTYEVKAESLRPGSIVVVAGRARYLREKVRTFLGYDEWADTRYEADGSPRYGKTDIRAEAKVTVVARVIPGGGVLVP